MQASTTVHIANILQIVLFVINDALWDIMRVI